MEFQIRLLHLDQRGVGLYVVAGFHQNLLHRSGVIGYDGVFHLHRFEHGDLLTGLDAVADFDLDLQIRPGSGALTVLPVIGCPAGASSAFVSAFGASAAFFASYAFTFTPVR